MIANGIRSIVLGFWGLGVAGALGDDVVPLVQAHAHNDYAHERALEDALEQGFCSVEADIWLVSGELLVAHDLKDVDVGRTLQGLYLEPLQERVEANGGRVFEGGPEFTLLVDVKSEAEATWKLLEKVLGRYREMVTGGAVRVVVSGNRARRAIAAGKGELAGIDGRLGDLGKGESALLLPLISDRWTSHFEWRGEGEMDEAEREKLRGIVAKAHAAGRRVRFWATADVKPMWRELAEAGVDLINTDDLEGLGAFLRKRE
ncbi:MAG: phosphatidylinositol-specific phospholipase C/glycerophosphodiester phosphodiesterase family protein [Verrucomicrobiales bacterium]|nr:phosphatidylinositol-specific phospholipase C/glycerophosphodiester phosphodiesterase family protein [Verrucomicrobiales bacterium]